MIAAHVSDTHGQFPLVPLEAEVIIHSGDMLPNTSYGNVEVEIPFQISWINKNITKYKEWVAGRFLIFSSGNHDYVDPVPILRSHGIDAVNIDMRHFEHEGLVFYGFPWIPHIQGMWNFECDNEVMERRIRRLRDDLASRPVDVLVAHAPPFGCRDFYEGFHVGNRHLKDLLRTGLSSRKIHTPSWVFSGHIHEDNGYDKFDNVEISNAATTVRLIEFGAKT